jgi:NAD(P)-dependent dehydrogenase (short-subunit alcohol dehydrogenase family)
MTEHTGDRVAIITGASTGIGAGLVEANCPVGYRCDDNVPRVSEGTLGQLGHNQSWLFFLRERPCRYKL